MFKASAVELLLRLLDSDSEKRAAGERFIEALEHGSMTVAQYASRGNDAQTPHTRDEVYFALAETDEFVHAGEYCSVAPGDALFVAAGIDHRFEHFSDDMAAWGVFCAPDRGQRT